MKIYLAAPVITKPEVKELTGIVLKVLEWMKSITPNFDIYVPSNIKIPNAWGIDIKTWAQCVFTVDVMELDKADWVVVCDFGRQSSSGTAWEAGYAFGKGKKILVIKMPEVEEFSLMTHGCASNIVSFEDFVHYMDKKNVGDIWECFFHERGKLEQEEVIN